MDRRAEAEAQAWRAALDRDALGRLVDQLLAERDEIRGAASDLRASRAWRGAHAAMLLIARASGRSAQARSALDLIRTRLDRQLSPPDGVVEPWPWVQPRRHNPPSTCTLATLEHAVPVNIIVPIHNAAEAVARCLASVERNTTVPAVLVLVDDGSTDPRIDSLLKARATRSDVVILRHEHSVGFAAAVNHGLGESLSRDVVLLNSDTEVPPRWLQGLMLAAHSDPSIGTVTPMSNNAGLFSVSSSPIENSLPGGLGPDDFGRLVDRSALRRYPRVPSGGGFCLYLKRAALDEIGPFDAEAYPRGYGEENDWCMTAGEAGWEHAVDDATFVFHRRGASYGAERKRLSQSAQATIARRHPHYVPLTRAFAGSVALAEVRADIRRALHGPWPEGAPRRRILRATQGQRAEGSARAPVDSKDEAVVMRRQGAGVHLVRASSFDPWPLAEWDDTDEAVLEALAGYGVEGVDPAGAGSLHASLTRTAAALHLPILGAQGPCA